MLIHKTLVTLLDIISIVQIQNFKGNIFYNTIIISYLIRLVLELYIQSLSLISY